MSGVFCVVLLSLFVYPTFVNGRDAVDASDTSKECVVGFRSLRGKKAIDLSLDTAWVKNGRTLWIGCSCLNSPPDEDYYDDGYWTGPGKVDLSPRRTPDEKIWYTYKNKMAVLKLRGKVTCSASGEYVCHLAGVTKSMMLGIAGCNATNRTVSPTEKEPEPTSAPITRPPVKAIPWILPHVSGRGVTLTLVPVHRGGEWRTRLTFTAEAETVPGVVFELHKDLYVATVYGLYPGNTYSVEQTIVSEGENEEVVAMGTFQSPSATPSGPVRDLKLTNSTANSLSLSWSGPEQRYINHPEGITGYFVELRNVERNRCGSSVVSSHSISEGHTTFNHLQSYTQYCVRVYPRNTVGQAEGRTVARGDILVVTKPIKPQQSPAITFIQPQFKTVLVAWKPPSNVEGGIAEFVIQYRPRRGEWVTLKEPGYSYTKTFYDVFEHSRIYYIRVAITNDGGSGPYSQSVQFTANTPVYNFKICRSSASDAKISWSVRPKGEFGADLKGIVFDYNGQRQAANVSEGGAVFGGLTTEDDHEVRATLTWEQSYFFTSDTAHVGTIQQNVSCLPLPPLSLAATMVTPTSFKLTWAKPLRSGDNLLYKVVVSSELFGERTITTDQLSITVGDLEEVQDYVVGVSTINTAGMGPQVKIHVRTKEAVPNGPVKNIKAYAVNSTTLMVSWEAPDDKYINADGGITLYFVHVGLFCGDRSHAFYTVKTKEVVRGLLPGMWYCLRVLPGNHLGFATHRAVAQADHWVELPNKLTPPTIEPTSGTHDVDRDPSNINTDEDE